MRRARLSGVVLLLAMSFAGTAIASEFPRVDRAEEKLDLAVRALSAVDVRLEAMKLRNEELAHRIAALKRLREERRFTQDATLERLLQQAAEATRELEAQGSVRSARRGEIGRQGEQLVRAIDDAIRLLRPGLRAGSAEQRAEAAKRLKALLTRRERAKAAIERTEHAPSRPAAWQKYEVEIDPLDGPSDLREKADFLEDTRDKLKKKRADIRQMLAEAQTEREILRATQNFRTEVGLFDEHSRSTRVARAQGARATAADVQEPNRFGGQAAEVADNNGARIPPPEQPASALNPEPAGPAPAPPAPGNNTPLGVGDASSKTSGTAGTTAGTARTAGPTPTGAGAKQLDPSALLGLNVRELGDGVDLRSLEELVAELERLDQFLGERAGHIRQRAARLEADEAKTPGAE